MLAHSFSFPYEFGLTLELANVVVIAIIAIVVIQVTNNASVCAYACLYALFLGMSEVDFLAFKYTRDWHVQKHTFSSTQYV